MLIYLAAPIDRDKGEVMPEMVSLLKSFGFTGGMFVPSGAFNLSPSNLCEKDITALVEINRFALERCDAVVMQYRPGVESWGCPQELLFAWAALIPVILIVPDDTNISLLPLYLRAWVKTENIVFNIQGAIATLAYLDKVKLENRPNE